MNSFQVQETSLSLWNMHWKLESCCWTCSVHSQRRTSQELDILICYQYTSHRHPLYISTVWVLVSNADFWAQSETH